MVVARSGMAADGLGVGMLIGAAVISPAGVESLGTAVAAPLLLAGGPHA